MAGSNLLALIDDVATLLDDVAILTKVAAKKTAGVLGDDLALNAQQVSGVIAHRELPVIWAVAKGSGLNKVILVPAALLIRALAPWAIIPLRMVGGRYLCYEGVEKLAHRFLHDPKEDASHHAQLASAAADPGVDMVAFEKAKIRGAIRTDFVLSAEIMSSRSGPWRRPRWAASSPCSVASQIGVSQHSLDEWLKRYSLPPAERNELQGQSAEIRRLMAELKRVSEERDILKKAAAYFAKESR